MTEAIDVVRFRQPDDVDDPLTEMVRVGARRLLAQAVELEAEAFLASKEALRLPDVERVWSAMAMAPNVRSRPGSVLCRSRGLSVVKCFETDGGVIKRRVGLT